MHTELSKFNWQELMEQHGSALALEKALNIKYSTIVHHLRKLNIPLSKKSYRRQLAQKLDAVAVISKYDELNSLGLTAKFFNVAESAISKIVPKEKKKENTCTKYSCNEDFFLQDNEESFYWAGFIMADGCVKLKGEKYKQLSIGLALEDFFHLEKFKQCIKFDGPIFSGTYDGWQRCDVTISSDKIFDSLARFNVVPRKSLIAKFPEWLISHPLVNHFMRGYFDGDGSIYTQDPRNNGRLMHFFSTRGTPELLITYRQILEANVCVKARTKPIRMSSGQGTLEYGGNKVMLSIRDFLYKDASLWLERKHAKFFSPDLRLYPKGENLKLLAGKPSPRRKPIYGIGPAGERITFPATTLIPKESGFEKSCVRDCLRGRATHHKGFTWHYE